MTEAEYKLSIPPTGTPKMEQWLSNGILTNQIGSHDTPEPDYSIRTFEKDGSGDATQNSALLSMEMAERIGRTRQNRPTTFTFSQAQEPVQALIDAEIDRNQWLYRSKAKIRRKKGLESAINEPERLAKLVSQLGLGHLPPVQVIHVSSPGNEGAFTYVSVGLHHPVGAKIYRLPRG